MPHPTSTTARALSRLLIALALAASAPAFAAEPTDADIDRLLKASRAESLLAGVVPQMEAVQQQEFDKHFAGKEMTEEQKAEVARIPEVAEQVAAIRGVSEVYSVTGTIDLIALVRVHSHDEVADVVTRDINTVPGVVGTETHIAFRAYSTHDLEAAFSLGD